MAQRTNNFNRGMRIGCMLLCLALVSGSLVAAQAADEGQAPAAAAPGYSAPHSHAHRTPAAGLDSRVQLMAKELDLDANQQASLKSILLAQRAEMTQVWNDPSVPAAVRVATTQAVSEKTAGRIRAILSGEQREKYAKAHQSDAPVGAPGGDVQKWMK